MEEKKRKKLLRLARETIESVFTNSDIDIGEYSEFKEKRGVFVTIKKDKQLRGCIGIPYPILPLNHAIIESAKNAAFHDPRFMPLTKQELKNIKIEISILSLPELVSIENENDFKKINPGIDGLLIKSDFSSGLLLPQVFSENTSVKKMLEMTCEKAGLERNAWKQKNVKIYKFQAEVFSEKS